MGSTADRITGARCLSDQATLADEFVSIQESDDSLLTLLRYNGDFGLSFFDIEDRACGITLRKNYFSLLVRGKCPALGVGG